MMWLSLDEVISEPRLGTSVSLKHLIIYVEDKNERFNFNDADIHLKNIQ